MAAKPPLGKLDNSAEQEFQLAELMTMQTTVDDLHDAAVRLADEQVGSVIDPLKAMNLWDNTHFILIPAHGEEFGENGGWQHDHSVYDELIQVPLIVNFPETKYGGQRT